MPEYLVGKRVLSSYLAQCKTAAGDLVTVSDIGQENIGPQGGPNLM